MIRDRRRQFGGRRQYLQVTHRRLTIALLAMMLVIHNAQRMGIVSIYGVLNGRYGTGYSGIGTLFSAYVLGYGVAQAIIGFVGDRFDPKHLLVAGLALSAGFSALFAVEQSYALALPTRFLLGGTGALLYTPAMKLGITAFAAKERGRVVGVLQAGAGLGSTGGLVVVPLLVQSVGLTKGLLALPLLAAVALVPTVALLPGGSGSAPVRPKMAMPKVLGRFDFWQLITISFVGMLATYGLLAWFPTFLSTTFGYSPARAGALAAVTSVALLVMAPVAGVLADLPHGRAGVLVGGSTLAAIAFGLLALSHQLAPVLAMAILIGVSMAATTAPLMLFAGERFGPQQTAGVVGFMATAAQIGTTLAGVAFGALLSGQGGFELIWICCALLGLVRLATLLNLLRQDRAGRMAVGGSQG